MASAIDICNQALALLGQRANVQQIVPPDGSVEASLCARFYPIARDKLLEMHDWRFATRREALAEVTNDLDSWAFAYAVPTMLRPLTLLMPESTDDTKTQEYVIEQNANGDAVLYTNVEDAVLRYIYRVTDPTRWTPQFCTSVAALLSSYLAGPIIKGREGRAVAQEQYKMFLVEKAEAVKANGNSKKNASYGAHHTPGHIAARA
ncbi:hypothetical protein UFOVP1326_48 [uncultured Caudovirales phage]|uniref:Tail tubular protein A n=1 Tax=uncultured Caudovirales phage TaxID=2100421 RepID=A0A6J5SGU9_9CAUD|nr:hypothetical protein UFOVP1326_48 [uncultured Caudovirales phage]CAB4212915.1 hypothetical protein UFOVP1436_43 [uncultured Caudovirales phage]